MTHRSAICAILALFFLATCSNLDIKPYDQLINTAVRRTINLPINDIVVRIEFTVAVDHSVITFWALENIKSRHIWKRTYQLHPVWSARLTGELTSLDRAETMG